MDEAGLHETLKRYLHGALTEIEQQVLEERLLADAECLEQLIELRDDWLDGGARRELTASDQMALEHQLTYLPALRARSAFAQSLQALPAAAGVLRLRLELEPPALKSYQAALLQADGSVL